MKYAATEKVIIATTKKKCLKWKIRVLDEKVNRQNEN